MQFLSEQHLAVAKHLRQNGLKQTGFDRDRLVKISNSFVVCVRLSAKDRGGISLDEFEWSSLYPNWSFIEEQLECLSLPQIVGPPLIPSCPPI
jgi:hypothetical protein